MFKVFCDCCGKELPYVSLIYNISINKGIDSQRYEMCFDCKAEIEETIERIKRNNDNL